MPSPGFPLTLAPRVREYGRYRLQCFCMAADRPASQPFVAVGRLDCHKERRARGDAAGPQPALYQDVMFAMMGTSLSTSTSSWDNRANTRQAATSAQFWNVP